MMKRIALIALLAFAGCKHKASTQFEQVPFGTKSFAVAYPNYALTPGDVIPTATKEIVCAPGYARAMRAELTKTEKAEVYKRYGMDYDSGHFQIDHLIPLSIGGSNAATNLWPQPIDNNVGFLGKQKVASYLHDEVCSGRMTMGDAQLRIRKDWHLVYLTLNGRKKK